LYGGADVAMHVGLALPQFDLPASTPTQRPGRTGPVSWSTVQECAQRAEDLGFESLWITDQGLDPLVALGALARVAHRVRLATMALDATCRPAAVVAKALATIDVVSGGRLVVGLGIPHEDEPVPLAEACQVLVGMFGGGPFSFSGAHVQVVGARCLPLPVQRPHPPIWVCGASDELLDVVARHADGWSASWTWTPEAYRRRLDILDAACDRVGRDPATVTRSVGLCTLVGEDEADLSRRFRRLSGLDALEGVSLDEWRRGRLVGTVEEVSGQLEEWEALGVDTVVLGVGAAPFSATGVDDMAMLASACNLENLWASDPPNF